MRKQGTVLRWDAARGFGFIQSPASSADVFFHKQEFRGTTPPREGMVVSFEEVHVGGKGPRAMSVQPVGLSGQDDAPVAASRRPGHHAPGRQQAASQRSRTSAPSTPAGPALLLMLVWAALLAWMVWAGRLPLLALPAALMLNLVTFFVYWLDKAAAQQGRWRIAESTLHLFSLLGGWPGAWFAQQILRHKSSKASFRAAYWASVVIHFIALAAWAGRDMPRHALSNM